jgi:hypothetical protein
VPLLESIEPTSESPGLRAMILPPAWSRACCARASTRRPKKGHLRFQPHWTERSVAHALGDRADRPRGRCRPRAS